MIVSFHKNFEKKLKKLRVSEKQKTRERLELFLQDQFHPLLENHPLRGDFVDYRSINVTGDLRAIFKFQSEGECIFVDIDTHSNLYS